MARQRITAADHMKRSLSSAWAAVSSIWGGWSGGYHSADRRRKILEDWDTRTSTSNQALAPTLAVLVSQLRQLDRNAPTMRGLVEGRKAELVGTGIGIKPTTGNPELDTAIRDQFNAWAKQAGALGESLWELQRQASAEIDLAGNVLWHDVIDPDLARQGLIPYRIQSLEFEDLSPLPVQPMDPANKFVAGVEAGPDYAAIRYHLRDPECYQVAGGYVLEASSVIHVFERRRAKMVIGEPRLSCLVERTLQDDEIIVNELKTGRLTSAVGMIIADDELSAQVNGSDGLPPTEVRGGAIAYVPGGAEIHNFQNTRPSISVRDFRTTTRGDQAGGAGVSRVWIDRDGSAYNFANSKFDQIRSQQMVKPAHDWFGRGVASRVYERVLPWILLRLGVEVPADPSSAALLFAHEIEPDVPPALDEQTDANAFTTAYGSGITTRREFLSQRGKDADAIAKERNAEQTADALAAIERIASIQRKLAEINAATPGLGLTWDQVMAINGAISAPGAYLQGVAASRVPAAETSAPAEVSNAQ